ncbi:RcnB family protein [Parasphingorhabdus sp.]|uniref:RcnB family protein n=1 Tax=Parasphingorhabdus sp. TaxID=2709688 RepID=UPI003BAE9633
MMKKILMILAASTMVISPMVTAQAEAATHKTVKKTVTVKDGKRVVTKKTTVKGTGTQKVVRTAHVPTKQRWVKGQRFDRRHAVNYRVISNPRAYRLATAPRGYHWVRSGNDAVLVGVTSGIIGAVIGNALLR